MVRDFGLEATVSLAIQGQLLCRQHCALLSLAEHEGALAMAMGLDDLVELVVEFLLEEVLVLAGPVAVDCALHWH